MVDAELRSSGDDALHCVAAAASGRGGEGLSIPVADAHRGALLAHGTSAVTLGIRPQFVSVLENGAGAGGGVPGSVAGGAGTGGDAGAATGSGPGSGRPEERAGGGARVFDATVELYEPLGSTGVLLADAGGVQITALTAPDRTFDFGERVKLRLRPETVLYFDPRDGANLVQ